MSNNTENFINLFLCIGLTYPQGLPQCYRVTARRHLLTTKSTGIPDPLYRSDYQQTCASFDCHGSKSSHHYRVFSWGLVSRGGAAQLGATPAPIRVGKLNIFQMWQTPYLSEFSPNAGKYGPEKTLYLDNFHTVLSFSIRCSNAVISIAIPKAIL